MEVEQFLIEKVNKKQSRFKGAKCDGIIEVHV